MSNRVERALLDWKRERPDLDVTPLAVVGRLKVATEEIVSRLEAYLRAEGLTLADFEILAALRRNGKPYRLTQRDLGQRVMRAPGTITARIDRLARTGVVERRPHPGDRRALYVILTRRGVAVFDSIAPGHLSNERSLLRGLNRSEQRQLARLLDKLIGAIVPVSTEDEV